MVSQWVSLLREVLDGVSTKFGKQKFPAMKLTTSKSPNRIKLELTQDKRDSDGLKSRLTNFKLGRKMLWKSPKLKPIHHKTSTCLKLNRQACLKQATFSLPWSVFLSPLNSKFQTWIRLLLQAWCKSTTSLKAKWCSPSSSPSHCSNSSRLANVVTLIHRVSSNRLLHLKMLHSPWVSSLNCHLSF